MFKHDDMISVTKSIFATKYIETIYNVEEMKHHNIGRRSQECYENWAVIFSLFVMRINISAILYC